MNSTNNPTPSNSPARERVSTLVDPSTKLIVNLQIGHGTQHCSGLQAAQTKAAELDAVELDIWVRRTTDGVVRAAITVLDDTSFKPIIDALRYVRLESLAKLVTEQRRALTLDVAELDMWVAR